MSRWEGSRDFSRGKRNDSQRDGTSNFGHATPARGATNTSVFVPSTDCGKIIGKKGSKIRELQDTTGARIQVSRDDEADGTRKVLISGSPEAVEEAYNLIQRLAGFGGSLCKAQETDGVEDGLWNESHVGSVQNHSNDDDDIWNEAPVQTTTFTNSSRRHRFDQGDGGGHNNSGNSNWRRDENGEDQETDIVQVRSIDVGRIIGRGGSKIRELQEESNASIKVAKEENESGYVDVTISGTKDQIRLAKRLLFGCGITFTGGNDEDPEAWKFAVRSGEEVKPRPLIDWQALIKQQKEYDKNCLAALPAIVKEFYIETDHIRNMHPGEVSRLRSQKNNIIVDVEDTSVKIPNPVVTFEDAFAHYPEILREIEKQKFTEPSPIQAQAWPVLLSGLDLIGIAQTGTGKTLAFLLPALVHIDGQSVPRTSRTGPTVLVLCPTRELAQQIEKEVNKINYKGIKSVCVYGGGNRRDQIKVVTKGVEIVVATPGRLNDLIMNNIIDVKTVTYLVLDEADRMLDLGFEPEIRKILLDIRPDRQTVMTSATWPPDVQRLADKYMNKPVHVFVGTLDLAAVHSVTQKIVFVAEEDKKDKLFQFLEDMKSDDKVIIFVGKKIVADDISSDLAMKGIECQCIHGDREQCDREQALDEFKRSVVRILVATDVASRGLDVKDITHVLNFDFPRNIEEYVHRVGRTGRAGRCGNSVTFMTRNDWRSAQSLIDIMAEANQVVPEELLEMAERYKHHQEKRAAEGYGGKDRGRGFDAGYSFGGGRGRQKRDLDSFW
ncbi:hypothetical protein C0Q70_15940 [Pomacea canaliculata]|uniref:RNA helicase n=1 Tax=Pomacea canaliculata TaxID=400727 RepID=A0A2T7NND4_POMCA|nr:hypothetical protein C0Q70_15940 [Pomacea canaliculata]